MKKTCLYLCSLTLALTLQAAFAGNDDRAVREGSLSLREVTRVVAERNPSIKAAEAKWQAMKARVPRAAAWEDLRLRGESVATRFVNINPNGFTDQTLSLEQELPLTGKNRSRARAATAEAGEAFEDLRRTQLDVIAQVRAAYYRLANEHAQLEVNRRNAGLLDQFADLSQARYEVGNARQAEILTAKTDSARLDDVQADILRRISDAQTELNVLMNRPAQAPLGTPAALTFAEIPHSLGTLQGVALEARPEMQRARNRIEAEKARVQLARRERLPDPSFNVKAARYNDTGQAVSELDVGISIGLPFLNAKKYSAGITEAERNLETARQEFDVARSETLGLVRDQLKKIETAAHHYELCRDKILPLASQTLKSQRAAYEASSLNFLELIGA
ncbi:MAG: TolC family protein, partial [Verrucomicrobiota bacterium]|nr:TolC family protein [Verrucomicrobiota bacterium]